MLARQCQPWSFVACEAPQALSPAACTERLAVPQAAAPPHRVLSLTAGGVPLTKRHKIAPTKSL